MAADSFNNLFYAAVESNDLTIVRDIHKKYGAKFSNDVYNKALRIALEIHTHPRSPSPSPHKSQPRGGVMLNKRRQTSAR
jgi:hypothetical protein